MFKPILLLLTLAGISVFSQEPLNHSKKVYISPEGLIYVNKHLPVFLWLSSSPDKNSEKFRLWSEQSAKYSNPMYFDVEGFNTVRSPSAVDTSTRKTIYPLQDIIYEVYADGLAPITKIDYGKTTVFKSKDKIALGSNTLITLTAADKISGVENIYYSIDGAQFTAYKEPLSLTQEKEYVLKYYSVDNVGNVEKLTELNLVYDKTTPQTKLEIEGDKYESIISGRSKIVLSTVDEGSGTNKIYYAIDNAPEKAYTVPIAAAYLSQGDHTIAYFSSDKVGNKEPNKSFSFYVDKTAPTIIEEILGNTFFSNGKEFSSGKSRLKLTSFDNKAGVKEVRYSLNNGEYIVYDSPVFLTQYSGNQIIKSYAIDYVNNRSTSQTANEKTSIPYIDLSGPQLNYSYSGPKFTTRDTTFINSTSKIILRGNDTEAGMHHIEYTVNGENNREYTESFTVDKEGFGTIDYTGIDNVDNTSTSSFGFKVDNTGPEIAFLFGTSPLRSENGIDIFPSHTVLFLSATDKVVGFRNMTYKLNNNSAQNYIGMIQSMPKGDINLSIIAYDKLGNSSELKINFRIE